MDIISDSNLIINPDGTIYHLHLLPGDIAGTIILVGDPDRVGQVSSHFDIVETEKGNREFLTRTGFYRGKKITVLSTGIGTDNIDIVINELDALVNLDLENCKKLPGHRPLKFIRIGTSGALHEEILPGSTVISEYAGGLDGIYHFYRDDMQIEERGLSERFIKHTNWPDTLPRPYFVKASDAMLNMFRLDSANSGITLTSPGFYGPQVRALRLTPVFDNLIALIGSFRFRGMRIHNFEMESSALYALASLLGHEAITLCVAIANRVTGTFLADYKPAVDDLIMMVLDILAENG